MYIFLISILNILQRHQNRGFTSYTVSEKGVRNSIQRQVILNSVQFYFCYPHSSSTLCFISITDIRPTKRQYCWYNSWLAYQQKSYWSNNNLEKSTIYKQSCKCFAADYTLQIRQYKTDHILLWGMVISLSNFEHQFCANYLFPRHTYTSKCDK